jgi:hypothetical protein
VIVFADYQLLAAMGALLEYLRTATPVEAAPLDSIALLPAKLLRFIFRLPQPGSEPLDVGDRMIEPGQRTMNFEQRWQGWAFSRSQATKWPAGLGVLPAQSADGALAFAPPGGTGLQNDLSYLFEPRAVLPQR